jgi:hypothetical protein
MVYGEDRYANYHIWLLHIVYMCYNVTLNPIKIYYCYVSIKNIFLKKKTISE